MSPLIFDCETGPLPLEEIERRMPAFEAPGNWKDPVKIAVNIAEQKSKWTEKAALSALTGRILAIGYADGAAITIDDAKEFFERDILLRFWRWATACMEQSRIVAGWNIWGFDLPFIIRRSWANDITVPQWVRQGRYWHGCFVDLMERWALGQRDNYTSLDDAGMLLNAGRKSGSGAAFAALLEEDREAARQYLANDLLVTQRIAAKILV